MWTDCRHCECSEDSAATVDADGCCVVVEPIAYGEHSVVDEGSLLVCG